MLKQPSNIFLISITFVISFIIISAIAIEYWLGHIPCELCLYERIPYYLSIPLIIKIIFFKKFEKIILLLLSLIFASSTILAFYHFGIEQGFFSESFACEVRDISKALSKEQLAEQLKQNNVSCKEVNFRILGFSLAAINAIFSLSLSVIFARLFINYGKNW